MSNFGKMLNVLRDGKPRTTSEMAEEAGLTRQQAIHAVKRLVAANSIASQELPYVITPIGLDRESGKKRDYTLEWARRQKREAKAKAKAATVKQKAANNKIRQMFSETRSGSWPKNWSENDVQKTIKTAPNSVFALGKRA